MSAMGRWRWMLLSLVLALLPTRSFGQVADDGRQSDEYHALRYVLQQFEVRKVSRGHLGELPALYVSGGPLIYDRGGIVLQGMESQKDKGGDSIQITVYGPGADGWENQRFFAAIERMTQRTQAPWGGTLHAGYTAFVPEPETRGPFSEGGNPANMIWYWSYPSHLIELKHYWGEATSEDVARRRVTQLAEALHRGFVEDGLAGGAAPAADNYRALIRIAPIKPGEVLSPSVDVLDSRGRPAQDIRGVAWLINGKFANSVVWDGQRTAIEVQVSVAGKAITEQIVIPAFDPSRPMVPAAPVPGLGQVGPLPGPASTRQTLVGVLGPPLIGLLGKLLSGLGGRKPPPMPPRTSPPKPAKKRRRSREKDQTESDGAKDGAEAAKADVPSDSISRTLAHLNQVAQTTGNQELAQAVAQAQQKVIGPDGKPNPEAWKEAQKDIRNALEKLDKDIPKPNSATWDAGGALLGAGGEFLVGVGKGAVGLVKGIGSFFGNAWDGIKAIGEAILNPRTFELGLRESLKEWGAKNLQAENKAIREGLRDGRYGDALVGIGQAMLKTAWNPVEKLWHFVKTEILPWDELNSFRDPHASLEEKLWAVPAAAIKIAGILVGLEKPTTKPSTRWGSALHDAVDRQAARTLANASAETARTVAQIEKRISDLERAAQAKPGNATVQQLLDRSRKALGHAQELQASTRLAHEAELLARKAMRGQPAFQNFQQAQKLLKDHPELAAVIDDAIRANNGGTALYELRARGLISQDSHALMTARKLQLQDQAVNQASRRVIEQEARALQAAGQPVPRRFDTFNATQGSRSRLSGSNIQADLDQTVLGLKHVSREEAERILQQECSNLGMTQEQLDINIYRPSQGLMDARGAAPNAQITLENIGQSTGTAGHHPVYVGKDGSIRVGDHVATAQGREGVLAGRRNMQPPPGMTQEQWLNEGVWEGHQGGAVQIPAEQWPQVRATQVEGITHAFERGDLNQMVKYANRGRAVGLGMDEATSRIVRAVAGQKDPAIAARMLREAGIHSPADLMQRLGLQH